MKACAAGVHGASGGLGQGEHPGLSGAEVVGGERFLLEEESDVGQVILIGPRHFGENQIESGWSEKGEPVKFKRDANAAGLPG